MRGRKTRKLLSSVEMAKSLLLDEIILLLHPSRGNATGSPGPVLVLATEILAPSTLVSDATAKTSTSKHTPSLGIDLQCGVPGLVF